MATLIEIGGVFLFAQDTSALAVWYERHLGLRLTALDQGGRQPTFYQELYYRDIDQPERKLHTVFAIMPASGELSSPRNQAMINYRVDDLEGLVRDLAAASVVCDPIHREADAEGQGKFTHLHDPEGNQIELWGHIEP